MHKTTTSLGLIACHLDAGIAEQVLARAEYATRGGRAFFAFPHSHPAPLRYNGGRPALVKFRTTIVELLPA